MNKKEIQDRINKNRDMIERVLNADLDICLMAKVVTQLKENNDELIKKLNS